MQKAIYIHAAQYHPQHQLRQWRSSAPAPKPMTMPMVRLETRGKVKSTSSEAASRPIRQLLTVDLLIWLIRLSHPAIADFYSGLYS
jgi:hypothetical protein